MKKTSKALVWIVGIGAMAKLWQPKTLYGARDFAGTTADFLRKESPSVPSLPFSISGWVNPDQLPTDAGTEMVIISYHRDSSNLHRYILRLEDGGANPNGLEIQHRGTSTVVKVTTNDVVAGNWNHVFGTWISETSRKAILNGDIGNLAESTSDSGTTSSITKLSLGVNVDAGPTVVDPMEGPMADMAVWSVELSNNEAVSLSNRVSLYRIRPGDLIHHWPLYGRGSPEPDFIGSDDLTINGTVVQADHSPGMPNFAFSSERSFKAAAAGAVRRRGSIIIHD